MSRLLSLDALRSPVVDILSLAEAAAVHHRLEAGHLGGTLVLACGPSVP